MIFTKIFKFYILMVFHSEFTPKPFSAKIKHTDKLLLIGSCFTEQIGKKLAAHKFDVLENPNGILFNPISISKAINSYVKGKIYTEDDLFYNNELWASSEHHTRFSDIDKTSTLKKVNDEQKAAIHFIKTADWILITLGSAFLYEWKNKDDEGEYKNVTANCHKIPTDKFNRRIADTIEIIQVLETMQETVYSINPLAKFIYTISPVRHLREGFIENNRSKAALIQAVHKLTDDKNVFYFPAYELIIDDLRDYRFFAEDLVHPNYAATNYVWEKFVPAVINDSAQELMKEINELNAAKNHKPFNENSSAHLSFKLKYLEKATALKGKYAHLIMEEEIIYFTKKPLL